MIETVQSGIKETISSIIARIQDISEMQGPLSNVLMLPLRAPWPVKQLGTRPLRACVVQTVLPVPDDYLPGDLTFSRNEMRRQHRNHLSAALAAVERMLELRETHMGRDHRLDWLILPELSVHPHDVKTHLLPFARAHKTIILAGLTYEEVLPGQPLINSAIWIIPTRSKTHGLQMVIRRQGKQNLAPVEQHFNDVTVRLRGFRPCQWLVGYEWSCSGQSYCLPPEDRPLWLTASICYDATDLSLAADLRNLSDIFAMTYSPYQR